MHVETPLITLAEAARMLCWTLKSAQNKYYAGQFPVRAAKIGGKVVVRRDDMLSYIDSILPHLPPIGNDAVRPPNAPVKRRRGRPPRAVRLDPLSAVAAHPLARSDIVSRLRQT